MQGKVVIVQKLVGIGMGESKTQSMGIIDMLIRMA